RDRGGDAHARAGQGPGNQDPRAAAARAGRRQRHDGGAARPALRQRAGDPRHRPALRWPVFRERDDPHHQRARLPHDLPRASRATRGRQGMSKARGVTVGVVLNVTDPEAQGRIQVNLTMLEGRAQTYWAPVATFMAGKNRGAWFMPEIGDEVLVALLN